MHLTGMRLFPIIMASLAFCSCASQKNTRVYAYRQPVLQGAKPSGVIDEKGKEVEMQVKERPANFFIYLEMRPTAQVEMKEIWIKQKAYVANMTTVPSTPVVIMPQVRINAGDTLVKATKNQVFQISPGKSLEIAGISAEVQKKINDNEVVIHCLVNGKERYYVLASIKNLPPVALQ